MAKVNKTQIYAIRWLNGEGLSSQQIADELELNEKQVLTTLEKYTASKTEDTDKVKTASAPVATIKSKDLMITHTSGKKNNSVAIMTKEASEINDEMKKKRTPTVHSDEQRGIFRPNKK
jgi:orotate phosphoribosyltransferase-like protein